MPSVIYNMLLNWLKSGWYIMILTFALFIFVLIGQKYQFVLINWYQRTIFLRSLCEIVGDCFETRFFSEASEKYQGTKTITDNFTQRLKERWYKVILVINNCYFWHICRHFSSIFNEKNVVKYNSRPFLYSSLCEHFDQSKHTFIVQCG